MDSGAVKSDHSLVDALAQLDIGSGQSRGDINRLPNEMLRAILCREQTHHLIRLRSVNKRWKVTIEDICRDKKCLMILSEQRQAALPEKVYFAKLSRNFNGHFKFSDNFVVIQLKYLRKSLTGKLCTLLSELFPNIEQFFEHVGFVYFSAEFNSMLKQWSATLTTLSFGCTSVDNNTCAQINELVNLKKLNILISYIDIGTTKQLAPTLARLEHFSGWKNLAASAVPYFGTEMTSFAIYYDYLTVDEMTKWRDQHSSPVSSLVRLSLSTGDPQVLLFICEHFSSLQMLQISLYRLKLNNKMIEDLARLSNLVELRIDDIRIDLATLDVAKLASLHSIRTFSLLNSMFYIGYMLCYRNLPLNFDVRPFCRILSIIFPNVENLIIKSEHYKELGNLLEQHVSLFVNLRSHDFDLNDPFDHLMDLLGK